MPSSPETISGTAGSILLVEGYEALAIAFGSALKQFAPRSETRVVRSLQDAEVVLPELRPTLLVLDCDPPPRGSVHFFNELKAIVPNARVLIVTAESSDEFTGADAPLTALQFIKKPFELTKFGAMVEALLGPRNGRRRKTARDLRLLDIIVFCAVTMPTIVLKVEGASDRSGEIHFADGRIVHASTSDETGIEALQTLLRWRSPKVAEAERPIDAPRTIAGPPVAVLREALRVESIAEPLVPEEPVEATPAPTPAKKIVIIDDTELLLVFIEEVLGTAAGKFEIATAASASDGLQRIAAMRPDLILLDYSLPDFSGAVVCEQLLANKETARVPVIMMSGHVAEMNAAAQRFNNIVRTIAKPFLSAALVELVQQTLRDVPEVPPSQKVSPREQIGDALPSVNGAGPKNSRALNGDQAEDIESLQSNVAAIAEQVRIPGEAAPEPVEVGQHPTLIHGEPTSAAIAAPEIPATLHGAQLNSVVLGLPLEVIALDLSPSLRVIQIRARFIAAAVSLHVLPRALPESEMIPNAFFRLGAVELKRDGGISMVRLAPARDEPSPTRQRYAVTIDGVALSPAATMDAMQLTPTAVAPMRFELLALFDLVGVELTPAFKVEHLLLTAREDRMRATFLPEAAHFGSTFRAAEVLLDSASNLTEIRLVAV